MIFYSNLNKLSYPETGNLDCSCAFTSIIGFRYEKLAWEMGKGIRGQKKADEGRRRQMKAEEGIRRQKKA